MTGPIAGAGRGGNPRVRLLSAWVVLVALHSYAVGTFLLFATEWGAQFGGFGAVSPLFFARQAGIFHFVIATAYLVERFVHGGAIVLILAKATAVVFLLAMWALGVNAWSIPLSAAADAAMGVITVLLWRHETASAA
ncbi:MAG TPA: hypothetical protein VE129_16585 [Thermoanaerobaculia bacterium]|nr:hypothetical protein [Thermoanaerobaculia bacterium]